MPSPERASEGTSICLRHHNPHALPLTPNTQHNDMEATPQFSMAGSLWFQYGDVIEKVSLDGIVDVADLRRAIKLAMAPKLNKYAAADLIIRAALLEDKDSGQATKFDAEDNLQSISEWFGVVDKPFAKSIRFFVDVPTKASAGK